MVTTPRGSVERVVGVAQASSAALALELLTPWGGAPGRAVPVVVRTLHAATREPLTNRQVELRLEAHDGEVVWRQMLVTGTDGGARTVIAIPADARNEMDLIAQASWGPFLDVQQDVIGVWYDPVVSLATDRRMYRPGQTMRFRAIVLSPSREALAGFPVLSMT